MEQEINISVSPSQALDNDYILHRIQKENDSFKVKSFRIIRRSIDARKKPVKVNLSLLVSDQEYITPSYSKKEYEKINDDAKKVIIIGAGPAGLFAALRAIELGLRPIVIERGPDVNTRRKDIAQISREGIIKENSNFCFGEGGAGTFSDGKLYTRSKKRGNNREILEILCQFGADDEILIDSRPHIGTDRLGDIIINIRKKIIECGGEVRFNCKMESVIIEEDKATGIITEHGDVELGPVFLATGHSSRDTYRMLFSKGVKMTAKGLAIGVRLEHPQRLIDQIQYHSEEGRGKYLPPAEYSFVSQADGRGVYTFCMCPGGVIVPAVSAKDQIVVNGMSSSGRKGKWANSGYVVELHPGDIKGYDAYGCFEMMVLQEDLEKNFSEHSKGTLKAPAQGIKDFLNNKISIDLPASSYVPGIYPANFNNLFPEGISERLKSGLKDIKNKSAALITNEGIMLGLESRTSSPVRIPRDPLLLSHIEIEDLYPVGEGAGYAGGIVSSAIDGRRSMDAYYNKIVKNGSDT